ncbi:MAG: DEAD/DEAH box helicase [Opitutaceae bacterium]|jgi:superfamily II DNA or RNA helicase
MKPRNRQPIVRSVRTPEAIESLRLWLESFDSGTRKRGLDYYKGRAVESVSSGADHLVNAKVMGGERYALTLFFTRGVWTSRCSCPVGSNCKHAYAAGLAWIASVESGARDGRNPDDIVPVASTLFASPATVSERALETELAGWLRALPSAEERAFAEKAGPFAGLAGLRVRLDVSGGWQVETLTSADKPWKAPSQKWLTDLAALRPADFETLPPAEAALAAALAAEYRLSPVRLSPKHLPSSAVIGLLRTQAARAALAMPDGGPLVIEPLPLVPEAVASAAKPNQLDVRLVAPDGRVADDAVLITPRPEPLYLFDKRVWRGPPPIPSAKLPVSALTDARLLPRLRAAGLRLPAGLAAEVRVVTMRPLLKCWLSPAFDGAERDFHAQLIARAENPPCEQQWAGAPAGWHWSKNAAPPPRIAGEPVIEFDLSTARAASSYFGNFRLVWDGWADSWTRPVNNAFPDEFLTWHSAQLPSLDVELSPELASLLGAPLRAEIDVSIAAAPGSEQDWFDLTVGLRVADTSLSADEIALLLKARGKWVHLPRHGWRRVETAASLDAKTTATLDRLGLTAEDVFTGGRPAKHRLHVLQLALEAEALAQRDAMLVHVLQDRAARIAALPPATLPSGLRATLRPYQIEGFQFLSHLSAQGFGGVLADDMGLGKTVQTLAWLLHLANARGSARSGEREQPDSAPAPFRTLIVCPKSVTHGWLAETARFTPDLGIAAFSTDGQSATAAVANGPQLLVANYTQLRLNAPSFRAVAWDVVVLDEGQFIKNPGSQVAVTARSLRAKHRVVLTGTPIENRLADLWSLFAFAQPGLLGDQAGFRRQYNEADPAALARLHRRVRHFLLRRTKAQAAPDLPSRTEDEIIVELEGGQRKLYDAELKRARAQLLGVETTKALDAVRFHVLASLLRLRQICCHPALVDPVHATLPSAKLEALLERVEELAEEGHQVLVFSQFVQMLEIIRDRLVAGGIGHLMLTGATENRAALVNTFQTDPTKTVFLLSLKAAGFGLNLTAASYAILYDPWWNPAAEAQAIDRIHRIGQTKPVIAYRILAEHTVEEKIRLLQREKAALAAAVVQEESLATVMDLESLKRILA